jgi:lysozyme family protein
MSNFNKSLAYTLRNEGGFGHDVTGPVNHGLLADDIAIYRNVNSESITEEDVKNITLDETSAIYKKLYWDKLDLDKIDDDSIATCIFDVAVNQGLKASSTYAQKCCTAFGFKNTIDGVMGPETIANINKCGRQLFITKFESIVESSYKSMALLNPEKFGKFLSGWTYRAKEMLSLI